VASNCSGALVLAEAGVLDGKRATTWAGGEASFQKKYPDVLVQHDINVVIDDGVLTSNGSVVSYEAAIALLAKLTSDEFAAEVANDLQFKRVANAVLPPRLHWKLASVIAAAAFLFGAFVAGLTFLIRTRRTRLSDGGLRALLKPPAVRPPRRETAFLSEAHTTQKETANDHSY